MSDWITIFESRLIAGEKLIAVIDNVEMQIGGGFMGGYTDQSTYFMKGAIALELLHNKIYHGYDA